jgi:hypothetical protein
VLNPRAISYHAGPSTSPNFNRPTDRTFNSRHKIRFIRGSNIDTALGPDQEESHARRTSNNANNLPNNTPESLVRVELRAHRREALQALNLSRGSISIPLRFTTTKEIRRGGNDKEKKEGSEGRTS